MARTQIKGSVIEDGSVERNDLNISVSGKAVARKIIQGSGITLSSTGVDSGTGDVTVSVKDYAEAAFTPTVVAYTGAGAAGSYSQQNGEYTRIGNIVHFVIRVVLSNKGTLSGGVIAVGGLPFTSKNLPVRNGVIVSAADNVAGVGTLTKVMGSFVIGNSTLILIADELGVGIATGNLNNNSNFYITGFYFTA